MRKNFSLLFLVVFTVALVFSCKKDNSDDVKPQLTCTLAKAFYFDSVGTISDSIVYTYTGAYITKLSNAAGFATLEYTSDKVTRRNFFSAGSSTADAYDVIAYNGDGTISTIKSYVIFGTTIQYAQYDFTYNGGKLSKLDLKEVDFNSGLLKPSSSSTFTYSGENISESVTTYYDDTGAVDDVATLTYAFDTNANYFRKNNAIFTDYLFVDALDGTIVPLLLSANNVTKVTDGTDETALVYTLDSNQNFYEFLFGGAKYARYIYDCK
jgi:hypothetical protein